jgi:hypothetical protein
MWRSGGRCVRENAEKSEPLESDTFSPPVFPMSEGFVTLGRCPFRRLFHMSYYCCSS